jgi:hypothetical protein
LSDQGVLDIELYFSFKKNALFVIGTAEELIGPFFKLLVQVELRFDEAVSFLLVSAITATLNPSSTHTKKYILKNR